ARIIKLHGTVANKGDHVSTTPWRLSQLRKVPDKLDLVAAGQLATLAAEVTATVKATAPVTPGSGSWGEAQVAEFLARGGLEATAPEPHNGALRWKLKACPFNPDHGPTESAIFLAADGRLGFKCLHNSCADRQWRDLRALVDGPRE